MWGQLVSELLSTLCHTKRCSLLAPFWVLVFCNPSLVLESPWFDIPISGQVPRPPTQSVHTTQPNQGECSKAFCQRHKTYRGSVLGGVFGLGHNGRGGVLKGVLPKAQIGRTREDPQQIVGQSLLSCVQNPVPYLSRLQRIHLFQRSKLWCSATCHTDFGMAGTAQCMMLGQKAYQYSDHIERGEYRRFSAWILT